MCLQYPFSKNCDFIFSTCLSKSSLCRAYSSYFMHAIVTRVRLPFFKLFSNFVHFPPNFQIFCPFLSFLALFLKNCMQPLLSRIGLVILTNILQSQSLTINYVVFYTIWMWGTTMEVLMIIGTLSVVNL